MNKSILGEIGMLLEINDLAKKYNKESDFTVKNINIKCNAGEIVALLGHNGAGKSTIIKSITGIHPYDNGTIKICGHDLKKASIDAKKCFGYVSDEFTLFEKMTGFEYINFLADIYDVDSEIRKKRVYDFQKIFHLGDAIYRQISSYSHGMKQKISFMGALIHQPKIVILDEPMIGLDPSTIKQVKDYFRDYSKKGNLILFSSHQLNTVEELCDRAYIIDQGEILTEVNFKDYKNSDNNFEQYFFSITKRLAK